MKRRKRHKLRGRKDDIAAEVLGLELFVSSTLATCPADHEKQHHEGDGPIL